MKKSLSGNYRIGNTKILSLDNGSWFTNGSLSIDVKLAYI